MLIRRDVLADHVAKTLQERNLPPDPAMSIALHLVGNDAIGKHAHGVYRLAGICRTLADMSGPYVSPVVNSRQAAMLEVDGNSAPGIVTVEFALREAAARARAEGAAVVGIHRYVGTTGGLGMHAFKSAESGYAVVLCSSSEPALPAPGGLEAILGTNPLAFAFRASDDDVVVADYASTVRSYGDIALERLRGHDLTSGVVATQEGLPSTSPDDADEGLMLPSGGHKGYCQAIMVELLCSMTGTIGLEREDGSFALVISLTGQAADNARRRFMQLVDAIGQSRRQRESQAPRMPGERYASLNRIHSVDIEEAILTYLDSNDLSLRRLVESI